MHPVHGCCHGRNWLLGLLVLACCRSALGFVREIQLHPSEQVFEAAAAKFGNYFNENKQFRATAVFADPMRLCVGPYNGHSMAGKIVVAERSDCPYEQKTILADYKGALALVLLEVDTLFTDNWMAPYPCFTEGSAKIPVALVKSKSDSTAVKNALLADPNMEISVYSTVSWVGEPCSANSECKGYPISTLCSSGICQCRTPYFNEQPTPDGPVCTIDPGQNMDSITDRGSCSTLHDLGDSGCEENTLFGIPITTEQCRLFPSVQCISDSCVCAYEYVNIGGQCVEVTTAAPQVTTPQGTTADATTTAVGAGITTTVETTTVQEEHTCDPMTEDGNAKYNRRLPSFDGGDVVSREEGLSVIQCTAACFRCLDCQTFYHNSYNNSCLIHSTEQPAWVLQEADGWRLFFRSK